MKINSSLLNSSTKVSLLSLAASYSLICSREAIKSYLMLLTSAEMLANEAAEMILKKLEQK